MTGGWLGRASRGVASVEFALTCPMLLICMGGVTDFGLAFGDKAQLAGAVALGAQYAYVTGSGVTASNIRSLVIAGTALSGVTVSFPHAQGTYCITNGTPPTLTSSSVTCSDGTAPGYYVFIQATFVYSPLMPAYSTLGSTTLTESVTVRIQ
jgi:Flp pilus assembly protein TadG